MASKFITSKPYYLDYHPQDEGFNRTLRDADEMFTILFRAINALMPGGLPPTIPAASPLKFSTSRLTDDVIKALPTTLFTLIPGQGPLTRIEPIFLYIDTFFKGGAYTNVDTVVGEIRFAISGAHLLVNIPNGDFFTTADNVYEQTIPNGPLTKTNAGALTNTPLLLDLNNNGLGNFTGGNVNNYMNVTTLYAVVTTDI